MPYRTRAAESHGRGAAADGFAAEAPRVLRAAEATGGARAMVNESLRCPSCREFGYLVSTAEDDLEDFSGAICHYCGHVLDREGLAVCLALTAAERKTGKPG